MFTVSGLSGFAAIVTFTLATFNSDGVPNYSHTLSQYETAKSLSFNLPNHKDYAAGPAGVAHTRSLGFLKKHLGGPDFDLEAIWDEHTLFEFGERDVEKTMSTMVAEPYVNHVPTVFPPSFHTLFASRIESNSKSK